MCFQLNNGSLSCLVKKALLVWEAGMFLIKVDTEKLPFAKLLLIRMAVENKSETFCSLSLLLLKGDFFFSTELMNLLCLYTVLSRFVRWATYLLFSEGITFKILYSWVTAERGMSNLFSWTLSFKKTENWQLAGLQDLRGLSDLLVAPRLKYIGKCEINVFFPNDSCYNYWWDCTLPLSKLTELYFRRWF